MKVSILLLGAVFLMVGCKPEGTNASEAGPAAVSEMGIEERVWVAEDIGGKGIIDNSHIVLTLNAGKASGRAGCNSYNGSYKIGGGELSFGPMATTRMACAAESMMKQEHDYLDLLSKVNRYERGERSLIMKTSDSRTIRFMEE